MCYHLSFSSDIESIYDLLPDWDKVQLDIHFPPTYHAVGQSYPQWPVLLNEAGCIKLKTFEWGIVANYFKGETLQDKQLKKDRAWMVNVRSEKVLDKKSYWNRIRGQRCLVPATGFYEFREVGWKKKVPYYIKLINRQTFLLPAFYNYSHIPNADGELPGTFGILIRSGNEIMRKIHNSGENPYRMPLMLPPELEKEWLNPNLSDLDIQRILDYEMPPEALEYWPVKSLYKVDPYDQQVIVPEVYPELPVL